MSKGKTLLMSILISIIFFTPLSEAQEQETQDHLQHYLFQYDVIIDIGHGGIDGGTSYGALLEKNLNLEIGSKLFYLLKEKGYKVGITRLSDYALSDDSPFLRMRSRHLRDLQQRKLIADGVHPKIFLSIHINYSKNRSTKGPLILYQDQAESYLLAQHLQSALNQLSQTNRQTKLSKHYFLLQNLSPPSLIAEVGFISNMEERKKLQDPIYQEQLAARLGQAISHYLLLYP